MKNKVQQVADLDQHARFLETARALGCDEDEAAFDEKLKAVVGPRNTIPDIPTKSDAPSK